MLDRLIAKLRCIPLSDHAAELSNKAGPLRLEADIISLIETYNQRHKAIQMDKSTDEILGTVQRFCHRLGHKFDW